MSDKLYLTLAQEIIEYRKDYRLETNTNDFQLNEYKRLVRTLSDNDFTNEYQNNFLCDCLTTELENLHTDSNYKFTI